MFYPYCIKATKVGDWSQADSVWMEVLLPPTNKHVDGINRQINRYCSLYFAVVDICITDHLHDNLIYTYVWSDFLNVKQWTTQCPWRSWTIPWIFSNRCTCCITHVNGITPNTNSGELFWYREGIITLLQQNRFVCITLHLQNIIFVLRGKVTS